MDIKQSQLTLTNLVKQKGEELASAQLALEILNETYKAEFTALETAQTEANQLAIEKAQLTSEKETINNELTSEREKTAKLSKPMQEEGKPSELPVNLENNEPI